MDHRLGIEPKKAVRNPTPDQGDTVTHLAQLRNGVIADLASKRPFHGESQFIVMGNQDDRSVKDKDRDIEVRITSSIAARANTIMDHG